MNTTIESLELELKSSSASAVQGIDALTQSLAKLKAATTGFSGLKSIATNMRDLSSTSKSIDASSVNAVTGLAKAIQLLNGVKISGNIANQIRAISTSLQTANFSGGEAKMRELVTALKPLRELSKSNLSSFVTPLKNLPKVFAELSKIDMSAFAAKIQEVADAMKPLGDEMEKVSNGFSSFPAKIQKLLNGTNQIPSSNKKASFSFTELYHKLKLVINVLKTVGTAIYKLIKKSSDYVENVNLFTVSMGKYADSAKDYAETVGEVMGIDPGEWMRNQGIFMTLATGFGVAGDRAATMSKNLTQLGYDLSSFFNIKYEDAMQKLQSGLAGELEPLRRIGYDLSQTKLEAVALELGIDKAVSSMTQAEKAELRYYAIMTQVTTAHGDMARTLEAPANQMKILKAQFEMAAREIGNIFIPALNAVLPYLIAVTKVVRQLASSIASIVGFEMPEVDYSGVDSMGDTATDTSDALDDAADSAKKLKSYMLGFDELNVINPNTEESAGDTLGFDFELPEYDFLSGATSEKIDGIIKKIQELLEPVTNLVEMTAGWAQDLDLEPIGKAFGGLGSTVGTVGGKIFDILSLVYEEVMLPLAEWSIEEGLPTAISALTEVFRFLGEVLDPVAEGIKELKKDLEPIFEWIGEVVIVALEGIESTFGKLADVCDEKGPEITSIFTGIGDIISTLWVIVEPIADAVLFVFDLLLDLFGDLSAVNLTYLIDAISSFVDIFAGFANGDWSQVWGGIVGIFEACWTSIVDTVLAFCDFLVERFTPVANWFYEKVIQPVGDFFKGLWESVSGFFVDLWNDIVGIWNTVATWFRDSVVTPVVNFFEGVWTSVSGFFVDLWNDIVSVWNAVADWFDEKVVQPIVTFFSNLWEGIKGIWNNVSTWFNDNVITPVVQFFEGLWTSVSGFFTSLWEDIVGVWNTVSTWFDEHVIQPIAGFFEGVALRIGQIFEGCWLIIQAVWLIASTWFDENVIQPIVGFFEGVWTSVSGFFTSLWEDIKAVWNIVSTWFDENVVQPVVGFFQGVWTSVSGFFTSLWADIKAVWEAVSTWFNDNVVTPVVGFFQGVWTSVSGFFTSLWEDIVLVWTTVSTWFDENVIQPLVGFFEGVWTSVSGFFSSLWNGIKSIWENAPTWFNDTIIQPVVEFFTTMWGNVLTIFTSLRTRIYGIWETVSNWFNTNIIEPVKNAFNGACEAIGGFFSSLWLGIRQGVARAMNGVISGIESAINWIINGINNLIGGFNKVVQWAADILGEDWSGVTLVSKVSFSRITVPTYAEGGFPEQGQMFIAREAGAEMVGNIGRRTAVANNDQIVSGIAGGVAEANEEQNALLREQNSLLRAILEKDSGTYLDGKSLTHSVEKYQRERGRVLITGGVV